ncbi:MAG: hypothetical protein EOO10_08225 [Chitinophagaceae bacterium]|nr:MAG: hypothetical protein EOO10_08225 [Chitinophagaceae bacterium]
MHEPINLSCGVLYVATGEKYIKEVIEAARSCKESNRYPIAVITDSANHPLPKDLFDIVIVKEAQYSYRDKLLLQYTPFEKTIFLDTDTLVIEDLSDLFRLLDFREFAIHQADEGYEFSMPDVSNAMPEFNTGVIAYRMTENVKKLFSDWNASFDVIKDISTDQYHLRKTLYESDVRYATVSSAYNFIVYYNNYVIQKVKVLHGRPFSYLREIAKEINIVHHNSGWRRTFYPFSHRFFILYMSPVARDSYKLLKGALRMHLGNVKRKVQHGFKKTS